MVCQQYTLNVIYWDYCRPVDTTLKIYSLSHYSDGEELGKIMMLLYYLFGVLKMYIEDKIAPDKKASRGS